MDTEDQIVQIEKYLQGGLSGKALEDFEERLAMDMDLKRQVEDYRVMMDDFMGYHQREQFRNTLDQIHLEMDQAQNIQTKKTSRTRSLFIKAIPAVAVAATVALIAAVTAILTLDNVRSLEQQQSNFYLELKKDLIKVKKRQNTLVQQNQKKAETKPVKQYGATAFVISPNGYLVTNYHVVKNADSIYIEGHRKAPLRLKAEVVFSDVVKDLSILKITDTSFIGFAELPYTFRADEAELGEEVYTLAYPRQDMVYGEGSISAQSGYKGNRLDTALYQISIPVNPGNSGGPLLDEEGSLLGIVSGKDVSKDGATFAVKIRYLQSIVDTLAKRPEPEPILLPVQNKIQFLKRPEQIQFMKKFIFMVKVFDDGKD